MSHPAQTVPAETMAAEVLVAMLERGFHHFPVVDADGRITAMPEMTQPRHGHGAAVVGSSVYALLGGEQPGLHASSTVEALPLGD